MTDTASHPAVDLTVDLTVDPAVGRPGSPAGATAAAGPDDGAVEIAPARPPADAPARSHGASVRGTSVLPVSSLSRGRFGRMFRGLPAFVPEATTIRALAATMVGPGETATVAGSGDGAGATPTADNPTIPAGYTYFGQFLDHDITFDPASSLERANDPDALHTFRTPRLDLDSVYGTGPDDQPYLYDAGGRFVVDRSRDVDAAGRLLDFQRALRPGPDGTPVPTVALIGDPRNDENILVASLHLTVQLFHNAVMDRVEAGELDPHLHSTAPVDRFREVQRIVRWHYQHAVLSDFLPRICGADVVDDVLPAAPLTPGGASVRQPRLRFYLPDSTAYLPVEFTVAAYRFGHSQIRARYQLNTSPVTNVEIFNAAPDEQNQLTHLGGHRSFPSFWRIEWARFFDLGGDPGQLQLSRRIDTALAPPLAALPPDVATGITSLAARNLTRGATMGLPSGQSVARRMGVTPLTAEQLGHAGDSPLWFYVLKEAELLRAGERLGPVGGRIVAEVLVGLVAHDATSFLRVDPGWTPFLAGTDTFTVADLVRAAGYGLEVPPSPPG